MKLKKIAAALLAAAMAVPAVGTVIASAAEDEAMKKELTYVKERIDVPEDLTQFSYNKYTNNGKDYYNFSWNTAPEVEEWRGLSVKISGKVIVYYSMSKANDWVWNEGSYSFGKLTREQINQKAEGYIKQLNPTVSDSIKIKPDQTRVNLGSSQAYVSLERLQDGVPVNGQSGTLTVDKDTGELLGFNLSWIFGAGFGDKNKAVSVDEAKEGFKNEFPIKLENVAYYNYEDSEYKTGLIYKRTASGQIDAFTGKLCTFEDSYSSYANGFDEEADVTLDDDADDDDMNPATGASAAKPVSFTPEEKKKLEEEDKLIKPEQMLEKLKKDGIFNLPANAEINYSNTSYNTTAGAYICNIQLYTDNGEYINLDEGPIPLPYDDVPVSDLGIHKIKVGRFNGNCKFNAETGEILSYNGSNSYDYKDKTTFLSSEQSASAVLKSAFELLAGDKAKQFRLDDLTTGYSDYDKDGGPKSGAVLIRAGYSSPRYVHDIPCSAESASIKIDRSGRVSSYSMNYLGLKYPSPKNALTTDQAYDRYFEQVDYSLLYRCALHNKKVETALVYEASNYLYVDAITGELVNYNGKLVMKHDKNAYGYTDLDGSKYKKIAEKLALYSITLYDDNYRLNENDNITREKFARLISNIGCYGGYDDADKPLTRKYAAKMLMQNKLSDTLAGMPELFRNPFSDIKDDDQYLGYMALADKLGYLTAKKGKFDPNAKITNGEALKMLYSVLSK